MSLNFNILFCVKKGKFSELFSSCTQSYNFNAFHIHAENLQFGKNERKHKFPGRNFSRHYIYIS